MKLPHSHKSKSINLSVDHGNTPIKDLLQQEKQILSTVKP